MCFIVVLFRCSCCVLLFRCVIVLFTATYVQACSKRPVHKLEDEVELAVGLHAVLELDDVVVLELAEEADFAEGRGGDALVLDLEADPLQGDDLVVGPVLGLVDHAVRALAEVRARLFDFLIAVT